MEFIRDCTVYAYGVLLSFSDEDIILERFSLLKGIIFRKTEWLLTHYLNIIERILMGCGTICVI